VAGSYTGLSSLSNSGDVAVDGQTLSATTITNNAAGTFVLTDGTVAGAFTNNGTVEVAGNSAINGSFAGGIVDLRAVAGDHTLTFGGGAGSVGATTYRLNYTNTGVGDAIVSGGGNAIGGGTQTFDIVLGGDFTLGTEAVLIDGQVAASTAFNISGGTFGTTIYAVANGTGANAGDTVLVATTNPGIGGIGSGVSLIQALVANVVNRPSSPFASGLAGEEGCSHGGYGRVIFGRTTADGTSFNGTATTANTLDATYSGVQGGYDWGCNDGRFFNGWDASFGGLIGHNQGSSEQPVLVNFGTGDVLTSTTLADFSQTYVGGYAVFNRDRITADVQVRFERSEYTLNERLEPDSTTPDPTDLFPGLGLSDTTFDADAINLTGRLSYRYDINDEGLAFVPTAGFSVTHTDGSTLTFANATNDTLELDPYTSKVGFIGGTLARSRINEAGNAGTTLFVSGNYYHEFGGDRSSTFTQDPGGAATVQEITASSIGGFAEASVGWNYVRILEDGPGGARQLNANIRADARFGDNVSKAYSITAQVRLSF
jgi:hypothetical protein